MVWWYLESHESPWFAKETLRKHLYITASSSHANPPAVVPNVISGGSYRDKPRDGKPFQLKYEFKGHTGAVYTVQFSPSGLLLGSGSFDKTVRIWDTATTQKELAVLKSHTLNISDLCWTTDSATLLSGAYDQTCKTWDVETLRLTGSFEAEGFVQCVGWDHNDSNIFFYGTSRNVLAMIDIRAPQLSATPVSPTTSTSSDAPASILIRNDAMVNTLYVSRDGVHVTTGDSLGALKVWDVRNRRSIVTVPNELSKKPISNIVVGRRYGTSGTATG
ncbi:WD40-repeat-containing domain protein [Jimgerdemannia flammicorona]|uniref:WD40-repeat-containing domain protein n=1 Tax=Jimgerdemannia flammicorona TaxID=994334 RepID=A0A433P9S9_9FUNG|nr:WD40-repeat-containing domain protein [Jimgerdemannia flammicorona]